jgi:hypothetical protein
MKRKPFYYIIPAGLFLEQSIALISFLRRHSCDDVDPANTLTASQPVSNRVLMRAGNLLRAGDLRGYKSMARMYTKLAASQVKSLTL